MEENDFHGSGGDCGNFVVYRHRRTSGDALVELAAADAVRMAPGYLLASDWSSGPVPHPLRGTRIPRTASPRLELAAQVGRALGENDPRGAREVPGPHGWLLRFVRADGSQ